ncbi:MAG TPA: insulinase family protein, partial [Longimicrobiales bacterium]|nr:insulinase family protein [Longimicrobiales bacterium]
MMHTRTLAPALAVLTFLAACGGPAASPEAPAPDGAPGSTPAAERSPFPTTLPEPGPVEDVAFPEYTERTLENGARLVVVENHEQPVVSVQLLVPGAGSAADPVGQAGLASVTASQLDKGTRTMTSAEIAEAVGFIGARLSASAASEWASVSLTTLTDFLDEGLAIVSDVVLNPTFPEEELETERRRRISELRLSRSQPGVLAAEAFAEA